MTNPAAGLQRAPNAPPKKSHRKAWIIAVSAAAAVVLLVVGGVTLAIVTSVQAKARAGAERAAAATAAVQGYMDALAAGDADAAWEFVAPSVSGRSELMTNEVLAVAIEKAPITDITVDTPTPEEAFSQIDLAVTYKMGGESYEGAVGVSGPYSENDPQDDWEIYSPLVASLYVPDAVLAAKPSINGVAVTESYSDVFPGAYSLTVGSDRLTVSGTTEVVVSERNSSVDFDPEIGITDETQNEFVKLVKDDVNKCLQSKSLKAGCGITISQKIKNVAGGDLTVIDGTVNRSLPGSTQSALDSLKGTPSFDNPLVVTGEYLGSVDATAQCDAGGQRGACDIWFDRGHNLGTPSVDFSGEAPKVVWD